MRQQNHPALRDDRLSPASIYWTESDRQRRTRTAKTNVMRWRIKTVLQNIIYCAVRLVRHAGRIELHVGKRCPWFDVIENIASS